MKIKPTSLAAMCLVLMAMGNGAWAQVQDMHGLNPDVPQLPQGAIAWPYTILSIAFVLTVLIAFRSPRRNYNR